MANSWAENAPAQTWEYAEVAAVTSTDPMLSVAASTST